MADLDPFADQLVYDNKQVDFSFFFGNHFENCFLRCGKCCGCSFIGDGVQSSLRATVFFFSYMLIPFIDLDLSLREIIVSVVALAIGTS